MATTTEHTATPTRFVTTTDVVMVVIHMDVVCLVYIDIHVVMSSVIVTSSEASTMIVTWSSYSITMGSTHNMCLSTIVSVHYVSSPVRASHNSIVRMVMAIVVVMSGVDDYNIVLVTVVRSSHH
jgi:hypothetical protein